jgi:hypothetical protein
VAAGATKDQAAGGVGGGAVTRGNSAQRAAPAICVRPSVGACKATTTTKANSNGVQFVYSLQVCVLCVWEGCVLQCR